MTEQRIDISKYAKGRRLKCIDASGTSGALKAGNTYTCREFRTGFVSLIECSPFAEWQVCRFVPVEDTAPPCLCTPNDSKGTNQRCPEHGRRCANPDCGKLSAGFEEWTRTVGGTMRHYCNQVCMASHRGRNDDPRLLADPYKEARADGDEVVRLATDAHPDSVAARARNVAALAAEMREPLAARRAKLNAKFGPRPEDDWGCFSGPGDES